MTPPPRVELAPALRDSRFMKACRREKVDATPVWLMRQAGRYMQEYRAIRGKVKFAELCRRPELAAEVAVTAAARIGADAAILFSDILLLLEPMGAGVEYEAGEGPKVSRGVQEAKDVKRLKVADPAELSFVYDAVRQTRAALPPGIPLIGFSGAPFTLAAYLVEGQGAREAVQTKAFMYREPEAWGELLRKIAAGLAGYLAAQVDAGAQALQIFDSWVGALSPADYRQYVLPHTRTLIESLPPGVPVIHFGTGTSALLEAQQEAGGTVIGVDFRTDLADARKRLGPKVAVQGNLDPCVLLAGRDMIVEKAKAVVAAAGKKPGHIFNLGHGVLPQTPVENVIALVEAVHEMTRN